MKLKFSHPYKENLEINLGQFTQITGQNQQLKYYIWQLLKWYFDGKRYSVEDLSMYHQAEPEVFSEKMVLKRDYFKFISISTVEDLVQEMAYKKGTVSFEFMKHHLDSMGITQDLDDINHKLINVALKLNERLDLSCHQARYGVESLDFTAEQLLSKSFKPCFYLKGQQIAFEFVDNEEKLLFFLNMLEEHLKEYSERILLVLKNLDDYLDYTAFNRICQKLEALCYLYPQFYVINFPSSEGYLYVNRDNIEYINIISDYVEHLYEFDFLYQRVIQQYPTNQTPSEEELMVSLRKIGSYLFSQVIAHISLSIKDMVVLKILNHLYQYNHFGDYMVTQPNPLELKFLQDKS
ncbi:CRISPR-associated protein Csn2-St [Streptococcus orisratti]|uniref:CRISPR-associated protein Csn2-St n=1 Tax=Streptococcus orisratti TaxID=114652 RepID=UPI003CFE57A1